MMQISLKTNLSPKNSSKQTKVKRTLQNPKMCQNCVKEPYPQRESLCSESGALVSNFKGCSECGSMNRALDALKVVARQVVDKAEDDVTKEIVKFKHVCQSCEHGIAEHLHEFWIEEGYQEYRMECLLCGMGENSIYVLPRDPKKVSAIENNL